MLSYTWGIFFSFWPAAPKGSMTYAFTQGNFLLLLLLFLNEYENTFYNISIKGSA